MNKLIAALFAVALSGTALAARTPEEITFETQRAGNVKFPHKLHAARGCKVCHPAAPAKLGLVKDTAHALCKGCHERTKGPTKCAECHAR